MEKKSSISRQASSVLKAQLDSARQFAGEYVLITGWIYHPDAELSGLKLLLNNATDLRPRSAFVRFRREDISAQLSDRKNDRDLGFVLLVHLGNPPRSIRYGALMISTNSASLEVLFDIEEAPDLSGFFDPFRFISPSQRCRIVKQLLLEPSHQLLPNRPLPFIEHDSLEDFLKLHFDHAIFIPNEGVFVVGWLADPEMQVDSIYLQLSGCPLMENMLPHLIRLPRPDVVEEYEDDLTTPDDLGFFGLVKFSSSVPKESTDLTVIIVTRSGKLIRSNPLLAPRSSNELELVNTILNSYDPMFPAQTQLLDQHLGPAVNAIWANRRTPTLNIETAILGTPPVNPQHCIIVPLYGRYDFIDFQLSQFASDPEIYATELVYVVDDPSIYREVAIHCRSIQPIYGVPFKLVSSGENLGFAGANNLGLSQSKAPAVLLMNSDVLPKEPGWLGRLENYRRALESPGAVGPKLLYEDGTVQHAGMAFRRAHHLEGLWINEHPGKGQPNWALKHDGATEVPALTAACMLLDREIYQRVGGLDDSFILGDFEDSDLCLKLREAGYKSYYVPQVELYHLERQSYPHYESERRRSRLTIYNCWRHTKKWDSKIAEVMEHASA